MLLYGDHGADAADSTESLFEYVAKLNGPLEDYHPQMLLQCLLWNKVELVKDIILKLSKFVVSKPENGTAVSWGRLPVEYYLRHDTVVDQSKPKSSRAENYRLLFDGSLQELEYVVICRNITRNI